MNISDIIPRINISILPLFEPVVIYFNHKKTVLVHTARKSKSDTIHMILVLTDKSEIKKWKSQVNNEQVEYFCNSPKILKEIPTEISENQPTEYSKGKKLTFQINFIKKQQHISKASDLQNSEDFDEEKILSLAPASSGCSLSVSSESNFKLGSASKYILSTSKSIKKFQWILFFAIIAMIGTNIGILAYIIEQVAHTNSLDIFNHLGQIMFYIGSAANLVRSISVEIEQGVFNLTRDSEYLNQTISELSVLQENVLSDKSQWSYCPSSKIVIENIIPIWEFDMGNPYLKKYNLYDAMTNFIQHGQVLLKCAKTKDIGYAHETRWLMINSVSYPFELIKDALSGLVECEKNRIHDSSLYINLLLWAGIIILGLCLCVLLYFIVRLKSAYENFWKFIKNSVVSSYSSLRQVALDRLTSIHGLEINKENDLIQKNPKKKSNYVKANIIWKFCWRLSFFAIISIAFILAILYLYKACETYMINRPKLLQNFNIRRALLARIGYFTRDINKPPYLDIYKKSYSLADPSIEFENTILWYWEEYKNLHSKDLQDLLSSSLKDRLFEEIDSQFDILKYGTGVAANSAIFDSFYMSVHEYRSYTVKYSYLTNFGILQDSMADDFDMADSSSKQVISLQLSIIIGITILFSFELALLYLLYYIPFIRAQTKHLEEASILPKMIPEIEIGKKFDGSTKSNLLNFNSF